MRTFEPAFDLDRALAPARQMTGRDDEGAHLTGAFRGSTPFTTFSLDGKEIPFREGQTIIQAARAG